MKTLKRSVLEGSFWLTVTEKQAEQENRHKMKLQELKMEVEIPEGVSAEIEGHTIRIRGEKGETERKMKHPQISIEKKDSSILLTSRNATKREKTVMGTFRAHLRNMIKGVSEGHSYKLKVCSGHFPMNVSVSGNELSISNFLGEKTPRTVRIRDGAEVKVDGDTITVEGVNKETAGQAAADIELLTRIKGRDARIFQDGIYITEKGGKELK